MTSKSLLPWLALLGGVGLTQAQAATDNTTLVPVRSAVVTVQEAPPTTDITLNWEALNSTQMVVVALAMNYSTVVLEDLVAVSNVECFDDSIAVTFNDTTEFADAQTEWAALLDQFVLITNHVGNCDEELERGFFLADTDTMSFYENNLTAVVYAEKTNVSQTAREYHPEIQFPRGHIHRQLT